MSLINEALQRAREEAVRQEAAKKGVPLAPAARPKEKSGWLSLAVLVLAIALTVSVIALLGFAWRLPSAASETCSSWNPPTLGPLKLSSLGSSLVLKPRAQLLKPLQRRPRRHGRCLQTTPVVPPTAVTDTAPTLSPTDTVARVDVATTETGSARPGESSGADSTALRRAGPDSLSGRNGTKHRVVHSTCRSWRKRLDRARWHRLVGIRTLCAAERPCGWNRRVGQWIHGP